ncbi:hypothetical protein DFJ74DRAFT_684122, partial [Hyaloraphidium curvatum]
MDRTTDVPSWETFHSGPRGLEGRRAFCSNWSCSDRSAFAAGQGLAVRGAFADPFGPCGERSAIQFHSNSPARDRILDASCEGTSDMETIRPECFRSLFLECDDLALNPIAGFGPGPAISRAPTPTMPPRKYGVARKSCTSCFTDKKKCEPSGEAGAACQRCAALGRDCELAAAAPP